MAVTDRVVEGDGEATQPPKLTIPTEYTAFQVVQPQTFEPMESEFVRFVLDQVGELGRHGNGDPYHNTNAMIERVSSIVNANLVTAGNAAMMAYIGFDHEDMAGRLYGIDAKVAVQFTAEIHFLAGAAWGIMSPKGEVSRKLPDGYRMVEAGGSKGTVTRVVGGVHGDEIKHVKVRFGTDDPSIVVNHRNAPMLNSAAESVRKALADLKETEAIVDGSRELLGSQLTVVWATIQAQMADAFRATGLELSPGTVTQAKAITKGQR